MRWATTTIAVLALCACADSSAARGGLSGAADRDRQASVHRLSQRVVQQEGRIAELEARLALLENEGREARALKAKAGDALPTAPPAADPWKTLTAADAERLPVVPLPDVRVARPRATGAGTRERYRAALRLVNEGRWEDAMPALSSFITDFPHDELVDNARYWRGEVHYAQRRYEQAIADFQGVLARYPGSDKAPDCLLKLGMSHLRLGRRAEATRYFDQVMAQYPKSDAARAAEKEGSS